MVCGLGSVTHPLPFSCQARRTSESADSSSEMRRKNQQPCRRHATVCRMLFSSKIRDSEQAGLPRAAFPHCFRCLTRTLPADARWVAELADG